MLNKYTLLVLTLVLSKPIFGMDFSNWGHDSLGYIKAERYARTKQQPILLYFHTDWCQKCARLDANFLANTRAKRMLGRFSRVEVNPERGPKEFALFEQFQVQAVPGLYVVFPGFDTQPKRIHPLGVNGDWTIDRFVEEIGKFSGAVYRDAGLKRFEEGDFKGAVEFLEESLDFYDGDAEAYFQLARSYEAWDASTYSYRVRQNDAKAARLDRKYRAAK